LPLTPNGKLDRKALPAPNMNHQQNEYIAPRNEIEQILSEVWCSVLDVNRVGVNDDFFALGGNSSSVMRVIYLAASNGIEINARQVIQHKTIRKLAKENQKSSLVEADLEPVVVGHVPIMADQINIFKHFSEVGRNRWNIRTYLQFSEILTPSVLEAALRILIKRHDVLRLRFFQQKDDSWYSKIVEPDENVPLIVKHFSDQSDEDKKQNILDLYGTMMSSMDVGKGRLIQFALLNYNGYSELIVLANHLVVDMFSLRMITSDLYQIYTQLKESRPVLLPRVPISYRRYAEDMSDYIASKACEKNLEYWLQEKYFDDYRVPLDNDNYAGNIWHVEEVNDELPKVVVDKLFNHAKQHGVGVQDVLLTAFLVAYKQYVKTTSTYIHLVMNGRTKQGKYQGHNNVLGWLSMFFPMVFELDLKQSPLEIMNYVVGMMRDVPLDGSHNLLKYSHSDSSVREKIASMSLVQCSFNYLGDFKDEKINNPYRDLVFPVIEQPVCNYDAMRSEYLIATLFTHNDTFHINLNYITELFERSTIEGISNDFIDFLQRLVD